MKTNKEIFVALLKQAEEKGYTEHLDFIKSLPFKETKKKVLSQDRIDDILFNIHHAFIYSHKLTKAIWGGDHILHRKEMIVYENPFTYLKKEIEEWG